jgi:hypothetical protein
VLQGRPRTKRYCAGCIAPCPESTTSLAPSLQTISLYSAPLDGLFLPECSEHKADDSCGRKRCHRLFPERFLDKRSEFPGGVLCPLALLARLLCHLRGHLLGFFAGVLEPVRMGAFRSEMRAAVPTNLRGRERQLDFS